MRVLRWASRLWTGVLLTVVLALALLLGLRLLLPLLPFSPRPTLASTIPASGATGIAPRSQIVLQFSTPMNPRSVERALRLEPDVTFDSSWSADGSTLTISPTQPLRSGVRYSLAMSERAESRWFHPLEASTSFGFETAPAPAVQAVFPQPGMGDVPVDTAISLSFSRPIIGREEVGAAANTPLLRFDPPLEGTAVWLDQATLLFQPAGPLRAGTRYTAVVAAGLADAGGGELAQPFSWSFSTPGPRLLSVTPTDGAERVPQRSPITLHFSQPVDLNRLDAALTISPTLAGQFAAALLPDETQVVTFTPAIASAPNTVYTIRLAPGLLPAAGNMPLAGFTSRFRSAPQPALTGRFPGEGQLLPDGQELRLIFNTPVDDQSLRNGLRFEPQVELNRLEVDGNEARITADFAAATVYTATIAPEVSDRNGVTLGRSYQLRFQTAMAAPALLLPDQSNHVIQLPPGAIGPRFRRTNLVQLDAAIYQLDEDSTVRLLAFGNREWRDFQPARAGLTPLRQWSQIFTDTLNATIDEQLMVLDNNQPLVTGSYYLRLRAPGGVQQDTLLFVGDTQLAVRRSATSLLVWATGALGQPLDGASLALYRGGALLERGQSGANGIWRPATAPGNEPLVVLATGGYAIDDAAPASSSLQATLLTDQSAYTPGDVLRVAGFVRSGSAAPQSDLRGTLALRSRATAGRVAALPVEVGTNGSWNAAIDLPSDLAPGSYLLSLGLGSQLFTREIEIRTSATPPALTIDMPKTATNGTALTATLNGLTPQNLPLASAPVSWTVRYESLSTLDDEFAIGNANKLLGSTSGTGQLDHNGLLAVPISSTLAVTAPLLIKIDAESQPAAGAVARASSSVTVFPASETIGLRLPRQIVQAGESFDVELLVRDFETTPVANRTVTLELYRTTAGELPTDSVALRRARVLARTLRTGDDGRSLATVSVAGGGEYRVVASIASGDQTTRTLLPLWVTQNGFTGWPAPLPAEPLPLVADRMSYQPGETAALMIPAAIEPGTALVIARHGERLEATVQPVRAGSVMTTTVAAESPVLPIEVLLSGQPGQRSRASVQLPVAAQNALQVAITGDAATYAPGSSATFTITTTDSDGRGIPADVVFGISNTDRESATLVWQAGLQTDASGTLTITTQLANTAQTLVAHAWAADSTAQLMMAQQTFAITQPLELELDVPPNLRAGDELTLKALVGNTSGVSLQTRLNLSAEGLDIRTGDIVRSLSLDPGQQTTLEWQASVQPAMLVRLRLNAQVASGATQQASVDARVLPANERIGGGALVADRWTTTFAQSGENPLDLAVVSSRAGLRRAIIDQISAVSERSPAEHAALLWLIATTTPTGELARDSVAALAHSQKSDGGWSWWPNEPSDAELTLFVLEGIASQPNVDVITRRALQFLTNQTGTIAEVRRTYAEALLGKPNSTQIATLTRAPQTLDTASMALLLLARSPDAVRDRALTNLLLQRVVRDDQGVYVRGTGYGGNLAATALALRALGASRPDAPVLAELRQFVARSFTPTGWPNSFVAAQAYAALVDILPNQGRPTTITLNRRELPSTTSVISTEIRLLSVPPEQLQSTNVLTVTAGTGSVLLGYQYGRATPPSDAALLRRDYLDPETGQSVDLANLRIGQLVEVRLTLVVRQNLSHVVLEENLPGGMVVASVGEQRLRFGGARLEPGVYQYRYTLQAAAAGAFQIPAPIARLSNGTIAGVGDPASLKVAR